MEAPGTAPGSETLISRGVYRHSRFPDTINIGAPPAILKAVLDLVISPWKAHPPPIKSAANEGQRTMPLSTDQQAEIDQARDGAQTTLRPIAPALEEILVPGAAGARSRLRPRRRLHGRRRRRRAGGARVLRPRHQEGQRGSRADQLPDAASPHDAVRDVRDQVPREAADLRGAPVDPPPHRQRERVLGALLDPRQRVLSAQARASRGPEQGQPPGPRRGAGRQGGRARLRRCSRRTPSWSTSTTWRC